MKSNILLKVVAVSVVLQIAVVHLPFLNRAFGTTGLDGGQWLLSIGLGASVLVVDEVKKLVVLSVSGG